jgi:hypothetical protein
MFEACQELNEKYPEGFYIWEVMKIAVANLLSSGSMSLNNVIFNEMVSTLKPLIVEEKIFTNSNH